MNSVAIFSLLLVSLVFVTVNTFPADDVFSLNMNEDNLVNVETVLEDSEKLESLVSLEEVNLMAQHGVNVEKERVKRDEEKKSWFSDIINAAKDVAKAGIELGREAAVNGIKTGQQAIEKQKSRV